MPSVAKITLELSHVFRHGSILDRSSGNAKRDSRVVRIRSSGFEWVRGESATGPVTAFVPTENILLLTVDLPAPRRRDRLMALPWAVEDLLIEPLPALHLVLGTEVSPHRYQVGVVRHSVMRGWRDMLAAAGLTQCRIVPDALALPVSPPGCWSVAGDGDRILARGDDGTAFAIPSSLFALAWESAGCPAVALQGPIDLSDILPSALAAAQSTRIDSRSLRDLWADGAGGRPLDLDLAQGNYAPQGGALQSALRRSAIALGIGIAAYTAVLAADTAAIAHLANSRAAEAARLHADIVPADRRSGDIAADIMGLSRMATVPHSAFLPLMGRASEALRPFSAEVSLRTLTFSGEDDSLTLGVQVRDFAALQRVETALTNAGIAVETGPAATASGGVEAKMRLLEGGSR